MSAAENLLWAHVSESQARDLSETVGRLEVQKKLLKYLTLDVSLSEERQEVLGNHLFYAFAHAKTSGLSLAEIATYLSIIKEIFEHDVEGGFKSMDESFDLFKKLLLLHSVDRSPVSIKVFEREHVLGLVDNMTEMYFRHFRMYQYIFGKQETLNLKQHVLFDLETVPDLPPLAEAVQLRDENDFDDEEAMEDYNTVYTTTTTTTTSGEAEEQQPVDPNAEDVEDPDDIELPEAAAGGDVESRKARLKAARKTVQSLKAKIAEIRYYRVAPGKEAVRAIKATLYFLKYDRKKFHVGKKVDWNQMRMLLDEHFLTLLQKTDVAEVVKRPKYASLRRISKLAAGISVANIANKSVAVAALLDWLLAAIALKKSTLPKLEPAATAATQ